MNKPSFEEKLEKLEQLVKILESGDQPLDESVKLYHEGIQLAKECHTELKEAEKTIVQLMTENGLEEFNQD